MTSINDQIRRTAGYVVDELSEAQGNLGLHGGQRTPPEAAPVDIDDVIRWRAGRGPQPIRRAPNGIPLSIV
jgi:hypothetical protein